MPPELEQAVSTPEPMPGLDIDNAVADIAHDLRLVEDETADIPATAPDDEPLKEAEELPLAAKPEAPTPTDQAKDSPPAAPDDKAPDTWTKEGKERWAGLPPELKAEVRKREADIAKFVGESQPALNVAKGFEKVMEPYLPLLTQHKINPWDHTANLLKAHATMVFGRPDEKIAVFRQLALDAGIDVAGLKNEGTSAADNPLVQHIQQLQSRINQLEQGVTGVTSSVQAARAAELESSVLAFAQDEESHPFFYEVVEDIQHLIKTGAAATLEKAYEVAILANPLTRQKMIEKEVAKRTAVDTAAARDRAEKAKKAASGNVRANGSGRAASSPTSLDDTLKEALANIHSRETH